LLEEAVPLFPPRTASEPELLPPSRMCKRMLWEVPGWKWGLASDTANAAVGKDNTAEWRRRWSREWGYPLPSVYNDVDPPSVGDEKNSIVPFDAFLDIFLGRMVWRTLDESPSCALR